MKTNELQLYTMRTEITANLDNPKQLEKLYRDNKTTFKRAFELVYPEIQESPTAKVWYERLHFENEEISWGTCNEWTFVIVTSILAGLIAKIPEFAGIKPDYFYPRNIGFIVFPLLMVYFAWKQNLQPKRLLISSIGILASAIYINALPNDLNSDTLILACIHLPLFLWALLGFTFVGDKFKNYQKRLDFLRYNGDLVVMTTLILIAGAILTGMTLGLFQLIDIRIEDFYFEYIVIWGLAAAPIVGTYLVHSNPQLVNKVSPVLAKVFTPLVLITLVIYLLAVAYTGKDPFTNRDFLIIFNLLLVGVMALILFSITEISKNANSKAGLMLLLALSIVTIIVNGIALSAILFRISEWGISPNRMAVLGGNILILTNLLLVTYRLFKTIGDTNQMEMVEKSITRFLPVYVVWTVVVVFVFPVLFDFI